MTGDFSLFHPVGEGSTYMYKQGCRCRSCREETRLQRQEYRDHHRLNNTESYQNALEQARQRKLRYRGTCSECGKHTNGSAGPGLAPTLCGVCNSKVNGPKRRGQGFVTREVLSLCDGQRRVTEIAGAIGKSRNQVNLTMVRLVQYGWVERVSRGIYQRVGR